MAGRTFLAIPGPTNIPDSVLAAFRRPAVDFGTDEFAAFTNELWADLEALFGAHRVMAYPSVGHGAWEATLNNLLEPGDAFLLPQNGLFATRWADMATANGFSPQPIEVDIRRAPDPALIYDALVADTAHSLVGVFVAHTETSAGTLANLAAIREAIDAAGHPGLFVVDAIASFATDPVPMADIGIDVVLASSQKGLMMPPGLSFSAVSQRALERNARVATPRSFFSWSERIDPEWVYQRFGGTPPVQHLFALREAVDLIHAEGGIDAVCARHYRFATAARACFDEWGDGFEINATELPEQASAVTCIRAPGMVADHISIEEVLRTAHDEFGVAASHAMSELRTKAFRVGHLGDMNEPMLLGALAGIECAFRRHGVAHHSGLEAAMASLTTNDSAGHTGNDLNSGSVSYL